MKIKYEIERKIEGDNGKKSEKETTITFDDLPDVKKAVKKVGAFFAKKAKEVAELATDVVAEVTYNVASTAANALDSVADTADTVVNSIDRFLDKNFEVVEEDDAKESCDGQCCGECCCGETCEDDLADVIEEIINELEGEDNESDEECCLREIKEETGKLIRVSDCKLEIDEFYEDFKFVSKYFIGEVIGEASRNLTKREIEVGMEPRWLPIEEIMEIFSHHQSYALTDEMRRGMYLREYTALCEILGRKK